MPGTEPLTGARVPAQTDGPLGGLQIANAVKDLAKYVVPDFATTAARDAAYTNFVTGGGVLRNGMMCTVGSNRYRRYSGAWLLDSNNGGTSGLVAGTAPPADRPLITKTFRGTAGTNSSGDTTVFFPGGAFPNGVVAVMAMAYATPVFCAMWSGSSTSFANIRVYDGNSGLPTGPLPALILHVVAWGW